MNSLRGELAIWSTIDARIETDYLHWLTREHLFERVSIPGFCSGRVFRRVARDLHEYLMLYELDHADVVQSPAYLERLNAPTPWTQRIMPQLQRFRRGGGSLLAEAGSNGALRGCGAQIAVVRFEHDLPATLQDDAGMSLMRSIVEFDRISRARIMGVSNGATSIATREKTMRKSDEGTFAGLLIVEGLDSEAVDRAIGWLSEQCALQTDMVERFEMVFMVCGGTP